MACVKRLATGTGTQKPRHPLCPLAAARHADVHVRVHGGDSRRAGQVRGWRAVTLLFWLHSPFLRFALVDTSLRPQRVARRRTPCNRKRARARSGAGRWWAPCSGGHSNGSGPQPAAFNPALLSDTRVLAACTGKLPGVTWWCRSSAPVASTPALRPHGTGTAPAQVALATVGSGLMTQHVRTRRSRRRGSGSGWTPNSAPNCSRPARRRRRRPLCASCLG